MNVEKKKLERERQGLNKALKEAEAECEEIYQLKFGQKLKPEILDGLQPTPKLLALEKEFQKEEKLTVKKLEEANQSLKITKAELLEYRKQNTKIINQITKEGNKQLKLDKDLAAANNNITVTLHDSERRKGHKKDRVDEFQEELA